MKNRDKIVVIFLMSRLMFELDTYRLKSQKHYRLGQVVPVVQGTVQFW